MTPAVEKLEAALKVLDKEQSELMIAARESGAASVRRARTTELTLVAITLVCGVLIFLVIRQITHLLGSISSELRNRAECVSGLAERVHQNGVSLSDGANDQVSSIEETSTTSAQVTATARKNAEDASQVAELLSGVREQMDGVNRSAEQTVTAMSSIDDSSRRISKIIQVINEIALQTNLLALNAAVEAARAGASGSGFAVVADEVRTLAQRSAEAARDTEQLIQESIQRTRHGKGCLDELLASIRNITSATDTVSGLVGNVRNESGEQARAMNEIGEALKRIEQVTQRTADNADQSSTVAGELQQASTALDQVVERLKAEVGGGRYS
jgi:methyl-accepting chemotaxis protein/methyl-accepting chemotaxis protein-1 (serine sensor receptor)